MYVRESCQTTMSPYIAGDVCSLDFCTDRFFNPRGRISAGCIDTIDIVFGPTKPVVFPYNNVARNCRLFLVGIRLACSEVVGLVRPDIVHKNIVVETRGEFLLFHPDNPVTGYPWGKPGRSIQGDFVNASGSDIIPVNVFAALNPDNTIPLDVGTIDQCRSVSNPVFLQCGGIIQINILAEHNGCQPRQYNSRILRVLPDRHLHWTR